MTKPCIITVAITGSVPRKENNPAVPITVAEQVESTQAAFEAGATIAHVHVRKDDQMPTSDPERFAALLAGLRRHCPGMIVQFSTGGRSGKGSERGGMLHLGCDMASLSTGSCNFPTIIYENHPDLIRELAEKMRANRVKPEIEVFDLSMLYQALRMAEEGLLARPLHVQFVFGVKNAMPAVRQAFDYMYYLERACQAQISALAGGSKLRMPPQEVAAKVARQFERPGYQEKKGEWRALLRMLDRTQPSYKQ